VALGAGLFASRLMWQGQLAEGNWVPHAAEVGKYLEFIS
jgi:hypothetical protein